MTEEIKLGVDSIIYYTETEWQNVEGKSIDNIILDESHPVIIGKAWICKACKLDNMGVICSECKKMYNPVDCELKD